MKFIHLPTVHLPHLHLPHVHLPHLHLPHHPHHAPRPALVRTHDAEFDDLEQRVLMSAVPLAHHLVESAAARTKVTVVVAKTTPAAKSAPVKSAPVRAVVGPVAVADPRVTDASFTYRSFASDPLFAPSGPSVNDVSQGELGDCYLLSVLSSVAKTDPGLIRQVIAANANGTYTVTFGGKHGTAVTVDADLATLPWGQPAYAQLGTGNSLWVALIEKAYADYVGPKADSYNTIAGGWMGDAFTALGLKSSSTFASTTAAALATLVQKDLKSGDFVTLGTAGAVPGNDPLIAGHAYEVDAVTTNGRGVVTALTLRNPWGNDVANGGYVTVTPQQALFAFAGLSVSHA